MTCTRLAGPQTLTDVTQVKELPSRVETSVVNFQRCPYDGTPIEAEAYSGGSFLLSCTACGAAWEAHNSLVLRVSEPDWDEARRAKAESAVTAHPRPQG
jgi:hypothetical protein